MMTTVMGLFHGFAEAQRVIHPLVAQGIRREDITLIVNREAIAVGDVLVVAAWGVNVDVGPASRGEPAALLALGVPAAAVESYAMVLDGGGILVRVAVAAPQVDAVVELLGRSVAADLAAPGVP
jgi:hypothetical protein